MGGYERYIPVASAKHGSRRLTGNYTEIAQALGVVAERVTAPSEIAPALRRALAVVAPHAGEGRPALVEFVTREETTLSKPW
jgi:acetolactate synthase-1/2/3 large subunit